MFRSALLAALAVAGTAFIGCNDKRLRPTGGCPAMYPDPGTTPG